MASHRFRTSQQVRDAKADDGYRAPSDTDRCPDTFDLVGYIASLEAREDRHDRQH